MVTFLPTPIGNLQDITLHTLEVLKQCDVLLCEDTRISKKLITLLMERNLLPDKSYIYYSFHTHNQREFFASVFKNPYPIILYESPHRLLESLEAMECVDKNRQVFLAKELTKKHQNTFKGSLESVLDMLKASNNAALLKGEWAMVVDKAESIENHTLSEEMLLSLEIPPKIKAKILAKIKGGSASDYYQSLVK